MKEYINLIRNEINDSFAGNIYAEFLKYAIRKSTITYSKIKAKNSREKILHLEIKLNISEKKIQIKLIKQNMTFVKRNLL